MPNAYFQFKQFLINQEKSGMKVTTDGCVFGGWVAEKLTSAEGHLLDIGSGTGLLSLMIAQKSQLAVTAIEMDIGAFEDCQQNFFISPWKDRLKVENGRIQEFNSALDFDRIVCNPPFYAKNSLGKSFKKNRAVHAQLLSQRELLDAVVRNLSSEGRFFVMYPAYEFDLFDGEASIHGLHLHDRLDVYNETGGEIFRVLGEYAFFSTTASHYKFVIKEHSGDYTTEFSNLLNDYYLYLD